jgi:hypothetical protein
VNYGQKKFYNMGPMVCLFAELSYKTFLLVQQVQNTTYPSVKLFTIVIYSVIYKASAFVYLQAFIRSESGASEGVLYS